MGLLSNAEAIHTLMGNAADRTDHNTSTTTVSVSGWHAPTTSGNWYYVTNQSGVVTGTGGAGGGSGVVSGGGLVTEWVEYLMPRYEGADDPWSEPVPRPLVEPAIPLAEQVRGRNIRLRD